MLSGTAPSGELADLPSVYLVRTEVELGAGSSAEFERQQIETARRATRRAGFVGGTLLRSYSHPAKYVVVSCYDDVETAWGFDQRDVLAAGRRGGPVLEVTVTQQEGYELVHELAAHPLPHVDCEVLIDDVLKGPEVIPAFEAALRQLFGVRREHSPGFGYNRLFRSGGRLGRYLVIEGYSDLAAAKAANAPADVQSFIHDHPAHLYSDAAASPNAYSVIARVPKRAAPLRPSIATEEAP
jgi:quinol monooxygenase YgiN